MQPANQTSHTALSQVSYKYQEIWDTIKRDLKAEVTVGPDLAPTLIQGVKRTKCAENSTRSMVGLIPFSRLKVKREVISKTTGMLKVTFELIYDNRL